MKSCYLAFFWAATLDCFAADVGVTLFEKGEVVRERFDGTFFLRRQFSVLVAFIFNTNDKEKLTDSQFQESVLVLHVHLASKVNNCGGSMDCFISLLLFYLLLSFSHIWSCCQAYARYETSEHLTRSKSLPQHLSCWLLKMSVIENRISKG